MGKRILTQGEIRALFHYTDGLLIRRRGRKDYVGRAAGCVAPNGYRVIGVGQSRYYAHRLIYLYHYGVMPKEIDHINRNRLDNRIENLRSVTRAENMMNKEFSHKPNGSVCWDKTHGRWKARVQCGGKKYSLGYFTKEEEALSASLSAKYCL